MMILFSSKTALGRAASPLAAVLPCPSMRPRVEHPEHTSLHDSRRKSALIENPGGMIKNSPGQVRVCERAVLGKRPIASAADRDAARQRESDLRPIPSLNLPNHRLSSQKTSLNKGFFKKLFFSANATSPTLPLTLTLPLKSLSTNNVATFKNL